jgi:hypothetical protein
VKKPAGQRLLYQAINFALVTRRMSDRPEAVLFFQRPKLPFFLASQSAYLDDSRIAPCSMNNNEPEFTICKGTT